MVILVADYEVICQNTPKWPMIWWLYIGITYKIHGLLKSMLLISSKSEPITLDSFCQLGKSIDNTVNDTHIKINSLSTYQWINFWNRIIFDGEAQ